MRCRWWGERLEETGEQGRSWEKHLEQGWANEADERQVSRENQAGHRNTRARTQAIGAQISPVHEGSEVDYLQNSLI